MNKTVLVTGASGFVGAHLAIALARAGWDVTALGGARECPAAVKAAVPSVRQVDLCQTAAVREVIHSVRPAAVIHAAALANTTSCENRPDDAEKRNPYVTKILLEACAGLPVRPFFAFISTDLVFDAASAPEGGFRETDIVPTPHSTYARTKRAAERIVLEGDEHAVVIRSALVYGPKIEALGGFMTWLRDGFAAGELTLFEDEYRTPVYAGDLGAAIHRMLELPTNDPAQALADVDGTRILHIGGCTRVSRVELGEEVALAFGLDRNAIRAIRRADVPSSVPRPADVSLSTDKLRAALSIETLSLRTGLRLMKEHSTNLTG